MFDLRSLLSDVEKILSEIVFSDICWEFNGKNVRCGDFDDYAFQF